MKNVERILSVVGVSSKLALNDTKLSPWSAKNDGKILDKYMTGIFKYDEDEEMEVTLNYLAPKKLLPQDGKVANVLFKMVRDAQLQSKQEVRPLDVENEVLILNEIIRDEYIKVKVSLRAISKYISPDDKRSGTKERRKRVFASLGKLCDMVVKVNTRDMKTNFETNERMRWMDGVNSGDDYETCTIWVNINKLKDIDNGVQVQLSHLVGLNDRAYMLYTLIQSFREPYTSKNDLDGYRYMSFIPHDVIVQAMDFPKKTDPSKINPIIGKAFKDLGLNYEFNVRGGFEEWKKVKK